MHPTRRNFLHWGFGSTALMCCGSGLPLFLARSAAALGAEIDNNVKGRVLVVVELRGGNDGLNTVVPYGDENYRRHRPTLAVPAERVRKLNESIGLHPSLGGFEQLAESHQLCIVQSVGYPNPRRSHFESMAVWQSARLDGIADTPGWLGRTLTVRPQRRGGDAPALHIREGAKLPQALTVREQPVPSMAGIEDFTRRLGVAENAGAARQRQAIDEIGAHRRGQSGSLLDFVERTAAITYAGSDRLESILRQSSGGGGYPTDYLLARRLQSIAQMIKAGLTTSIYYTEFGDFDTHANQEGTHPFLLQQVGDSLRAFVADLTSAGEAGRVLVLLFSEFGRRLDENGSGGTDHGAAAPVFLAGAAVRQLLVGPSLDLSNLDAEGDPKHSIDFRRIYATLLDQWLACDSRAVLGERFDPLAIV